MLQVHCIGLLALLALLSGCGSLEADPVSASDRDAETLQGRISFDATPRPQGLFPEGAGLVDDYDPGLRFSSGFEFEYQYSEFDGRQQLGPTQVVQLSNGVAFTGPGTLNVDADYRNFLFHGRAGMLFLEAFRVSFLGGFQVSDISVRVRQGALRDRESVTSGGPSWGFRGDVFLFEWLNIFGQFREANLIGDSAFDYEIREATEVGVTVAPHARLGLTAGYRWEEIDLRSDDDLFSFTNRSDIELRWEGGFVGLEIRF